MSDNSLLEIVFKYKFQLNLLVVVLLMKVFVNGDLENYFNYDGVLYIILK